MKPKTKNTKLQLEFNPKMLEALERIAKRNNWNLEQTIRSLTRLGMRTRKLG